MNTRITLIDEMIRARAMKILLIRYHGRGTVNSREVKNITGSMGIWPPLGLLYLGAALKQQGHDVQVLDVMASGLDSGEAREMIAAAQSDIVGITATTPEIRGVMEAARFARRTGAQVVAGGPHLGMFAAETVSSPDIDFAIQGDGEIPLVRLLEELESPHPDFSTVPGLVYKDGNGINSNGTYIEHNLDGLPIPDWSLVARKAYSRMDALRPVATMITARGCPHRCGFCYRGPDGSIVRYRSPRAVVDEMEFLAQRWGVREIIFANDTLTLNRDMVITMCEELLNRDIQLRWQGATRVDAVDPEVLNLMKRAGCKQLKFGIESGSDAILQLMAKGITREQSHRALDWCRQIGIRTGAYFILGYAGDNERTIQQTIDFARDLDPDFVMFYAGVPLPGTDFHSRAVQAGKIDPDYWCDYVQGKRNDRLPYLVTDLDRWIRRAFRRFYGRPSYLLKQLFRRDMWSALLRNPSLVLTLFFPDNT